MDTYAAAPRVLVLEDDADMARLLSEILTAEGFEAIVADERLSLEALARARPRLLLADYVLDGWGDRLMRAVRDGRVERVPIVLLSGVNEIERRAREVGAAAFVAKPFDIDDLIDVCRQAAAV